MPIMFNLVLAQAGLDLESVILVRHQDRRSDKGRTPFELWRDDRAAFLTYISLQGFDNRSKFARASSWATFVGTPMGETMFVGLFDASYRGATDHDVPKPNTTGIHLAGSIDIYDLKENPVLTDLVGKLSIEWGDAARAWVQRADRQNKIVTELRLQFYEPSFPGFLQFVSPLSKIETLPGAWAAVLRSARGVYLLTCPKTKEQYVGSATGTGGFWHRWLDYCRTGHGGNLGLKARDPSDYQVSILEVAGSATTDEQIVAMETLWKLKLQSREMGLNRN